MKGITWELHDGVVLGQIDMKKARKLFESGKSFFLAMENMRPDFAIEVGKRDYEEESFDKIINAFLFYNRGRDWGYRCRFYKRL